MSILRKALENADVSNADEKTIVLKGPLSEVYAKALDEVYAKDQNEDEVSLEAADKNKKPQKKMKLKIKKGSFHEWLGKKPGEPISDKDIEKGLKSDDPHVRKMAQFAKNAKKWHHKKKKVAKEEFTGVALESMERLYIRSLETQQMDANIMAKLSNAIDDSNTSPTDKFTTVYGTSRNDVDEDTIVDVATELADAPENSEFVLVVDYTGPGGDGSSSERVEELGNALECLVESFKGKVYHSFKDYINSRR